LVQNEGDIAKGNGVDTGWSEDVWLERSRWRWISDGIKMELHEQTKWWQVRATGCISSSFGPVETKIKQFYKSLF